MRSRTISLSRLDSYLKSKLDRTRRLKEKGRPLAMEAAKKLILSNLTSGFDESISPTGEAWPETKDGKGAGLILIKSGEMRKFALASAKNAAGKDDKLVVPMTTGASGGTFYGFKHQRALFKLPKRQWYGFNREQLVEIAVAAAKEAARACISD